MLNRVATYPAEAHVPVNSAADAHGCSSMFVTRGIPKRSIKGRKIWVDLDNSPHVPFFAPIIEELQRQGAEVMLTARNMYQTCELLDFFNIPCKVVGGHYGRNKALKVMSNCLRAAQLLPIAAKARPSLALSHGARAQVLVCKLLGIPAVMMHDYEHSTKTGFIRPDWIFMPDVIPSSLMSKRVETVVKYPGIKEDVYIPRFHPDAAVLQDLGIQENEIVVTLRPPANEAHYHNPESDILFSETLRYLADDPRVRMITIPRNRRQNLRLHREWSELISSGRMIVPDHPLDGLNLIWFSDLVISGGGTMNREAAALGVPVYSLFRGKLGAVDKYLAAQGRLHLINTVQDVRTKIIVRRWERPESPQRGDRPALQSIVDSVVTILTGVHATAMVPQ
jgi:uncharacterized protein